MRREEAARIAGVDVLEGDGARLKNLLAVLPHAEALPPRVLLRLQARWTAGADGGVTLGEEGGDAEEVEVETDEGELEVEAAEAEADDLP